VKKVLLKFPKLITEEVDIVPNHSRDVFLTMVFKPFLYIPFTPFFHMALQYMALQVTALKSELILC